MMTTLTVEELPLLFSDLTPIPQADGTGGGDGSAVCCAIAYKPDFVAAHDYMRAVLKADERSGRAILLTGLCLKLNPANYTIWHFRRLCLKELGLTDGVVRRDLDLASELGGPNPKNYQIAFHRRALLDELGLTLERAKRELNYIAKVLQEEDGKNYHMWSSRQWILRTFTAKPTTDDVSNNENDDSNNDGDDLWRDEIEFTNQLIAQDCRNNSAWNQRWFAVHRGSRDAVTEEVARREADYAIEVAQLDPYNESPWRYLIGTVKEHPALASRYEQAASDIKSLLVEAERDPDGCANLNSARIDLLEMKGSVPAIDEAIELCNSMATEHDVIRRKYWEYRANDLQQRI